MIPTPKDLPEQWRSAEEAEAVLEQLARALAPAGADLQQMAHILSEKVAHNEDLGPDGERTRAEHLLLRAQARYRALVEQIPAVTFMAPLDGTVSELYVSPQIEHLLGFSAQEWLHNPILWYSQLHPDDQERWQTEFARTLNAGEHFRSIYRFIARDGRIVWVHGEAKVVSDDEGRPLFLQGIAFDITDLKRAEEQLQQTNTHLALARDQALDASRAKSAFLADLSHELRTPLNAIIGFSEILCEDAVDVGAESIVPDIEKIRGSAKHLLSLISGILDLSKIEAGRMDLYLEDFDIEEMLAEVTDSVLPILKQNGNQLSWQRTGELGTIHADVTKLRQVLLNLLSNAGKFTENGRVTLLAERVEIDDAEWLRFCVCDTGIGIPAEQHAKLFRSFVQADDSTTRKYGGTGLGLAISQRFCQMMGGTIRLQSAPGQGSTFTVQLPAVVQPVAELPPENAAPPPEPATAVDETTERAERAAQELREQQQSVHLLQAEVDEAWKQVESLKHLEQVAQQLRTERDAALAALLQTGILPARGAEALLPGRPDTEAERSRTVRRRKRLRRQEESLREDRRETREQMKELRKLTALLVAFARELKTIPRAEETRPPRPAAEC